MLTKRKCDNWLNSYTYYCHDSEPPTKFHEWMGVSVIAAALQRKCCLKWGSLIFYPNFFLVLVAPPGRARKGTAMAFARKFIDRMNIPLISDTTSLQALIRRMSESTNTEESSEEGYFESHSSVTAFSPELSVFLGFSNRELISNLCNFYDCLDVFRYETISRDVEEVIGVFLNLVGATTPNQIKETMSTDTIGIGLTSRIIFIYEEKIKKRVVCPFFTLSEEGKQLEKDLIEDLTKIRSLRGDFKVSKGFLKLWTDWYGNYPEESTFDPAHFGNYWERRPTHIFKLSMVISASSSDDMIISEKHLRTAIDFLTATEVNMPRTFQFMGQYSQAENMQKVMAFIALRGTVYLNELMNEFIMYMSEWDLDNILKSLKTANFIYPFSTKAGKTIITHRIDDSVQNLNIEEI